MHNHPVLFEITKYHDVKSKSLFKVPNYQSPKSISIRSPNVRSRVSMLKILVLLFKKKSLQSTVPITNFQSTVLFKIPKVFKVYLTFMTGASRLECLDTKSWDYALPTCTFQPGNSQ